MFEVADFRVQLFVFRKWQFFYLLLYITICQSRQIRDKELT